MLLLVGLALALLGGVLVFVGRIPGISRLPGDFAIQMEGFSCFFPLATSILLSIVLTVLINVILRIINK
ncbi:MAG: DUF2905 domain-containing protein [Chloroflexi bacterium]|nr:DUF2905 domain-containing protein [Chloroflexota bacterium]